MVAYANLLLAGAGFVHGAVQARPDHVVLLARSSKGKNVRLVAPLREYTAGLISFQSILEVRAGGIASWDAAGHPVHGCAALAHFGDSGPRLAASRDSIAAHMRSGEPAPYQDPDGYREDVERMLEERLSRGIYGDDFEIIVGGERTLLSLNEGLASAA